MKHAGDEDHEEPLAKRRQSPGKGRPQNEEDINAEPATSSDEDLRKPQPRIPKQTSAIKRRAGLDGSDELKVPQQKSKRKQRDIQTKPTEEAELRQPSKSKRRLDDDKENNSTVAPQSSSRSTQDDPFDFGMEHASQRSNKSKKATKFGGTKNIHAQPPVKKVRQAPPPRVPQANKMHSKQASRAKSVPEEDGSDSEFSMIGLEELEDTQGGPSQPDSDIHPSTSEDKDLKRASRRSKPNILHNQLGDWMQDRAPESSQPASSAPQENYGELKDYIEQLPEEEVEGSRCPICRAPVKKDDYWDYWKGKDKTVKNQNTFCRSHKTKSAWEEYRSEGYPDMNWDALPQRIKKHRMDLFKILNNDRSSAYRDRYEPIALTGKAAAVPSRRKDLPEHVQQELESYALDDQSTYPGYYGPHGRRLITETVMKELKNEIKNCSDSVVQGSGPATFVQAVLVPEAAIMLIMEDCGVDRQEAEEIREKTYDLGMLLNEEIDDKVEVHEQSDDDNEYGGR
jgi:hypothetical protein